MKKVFALFLCLALLACGAAAAEKTSIGTVNVNGDFNIRCALPEDYKVTILNSSGDMIQARIGSDNPDKPVIMLYIAFNEEYTLDDGTPSGKALRLNDVSEEGLEAIRQSFRDITENAVFEDAETAYGTKLLIVRYTLASIKYVGVYSIYNSYEIEAIASAGENAEVNKLTEEQVQTIIDFMSEMDFEEIN